MSKSSSISRRLIAGLGAALLLGGLLSPLGAQETTRPVAKKKEKPPEVVLPWPPKLPGGEQMVTDTTPDFVKRRDDLLEGVTVAMTPPTVEFMFYPEQNYPGVPWSVWGDSAFFGGKYYSAIGDHRSVIKAIAESAGRALVFEYDPATRKLRKVSDTSEIIKRPQGYYVPGKIHARLGVDKDGNIYYSTHRGSEGATTDANHYEGDWIIKCDPKSGKSEIIAQAPVAKHSYPAAIFDPDRMIFYAGTASGKDSGDPDGTVDFLAYDVVHKKVLYHGPEGADRCLMLARSTGRVYYTAGRRGNVDGATLMRFHPDENGGKPVKVMDNAPGMRAATSETGDGLIYGCSQAYDIRAGKNDPPQHIPSRLWVFDTRTEKYKDLGEAAVNKPDYVAQLDIDPTGRYVYYIPGAHGSAASGGSPVIQYDTKAKVRKVIAFLNPYYTDKYNVSPAGTFGAALDEKGETLYITWNVNRGGKNWDSCALMVVHIPESERPTGT